MHEFSKSLDLLNLIEDDLDKDFERKRKLDQERENKISYFTNQLQKEEISVQDFLEAMSDKSVLPGSGKLAVN